jgi:hypothetical protein
MAKIRVKVHQLWEDFTHWQTQADLLDFSMFEEQINDVLVKYPYLNKGEINGTTILRGSVEVIDKDGKIWDTYQIEIHPQGEFPYCFPKLFEVGGKIPKNVNWHIYTADGSCCLTVLQKEILACVNGITVLQFMENWVIPYLANQTYRFNTGNYSNGEYSHNVLLATIEFYQELFRTCDVDLIINYIFIIVSSSRPHRTELCFCGSKQKFRNCHKSAFYICSLLKDKTLIYDLIILKEQSKLYRNMNLDTIQKLIFR